MSTKEKPPLLRLWEKLGAPMRATNHLHDTRIFRAAVYGPVLISVTIALLGYFRSPIEPNWTLQGFNNFIALFKLPIGVAGLAIPLAALVASHHRSIQSASQIESQQNQNTFSNYVKHKEYFGKYLEEENLLNGTTSFKAENKQVYNVLFPFAAEGDLRPQLSLTTEEIDDIEDLVAETANLSKEITWDNQDHLERLGTCIGHLRSEIQRAFNLEIIDPNYALSVENLIIELKAIITTIKHLSSASIFLAAYEVDENLGNWSLTLTLALKPLEKVRQFEHAEERLQQLAESSAKVGSITVNADQLSHIKKLLAEDPQAKLDMLEKRYDKNLTLRKVIEIIRKNL